MADSFSAFQIARSYGRSKLLRSRIVMRLLTDPVFKSAWKLIVHRGRPVLDLGCGMGFLGISMRGAGLTERYRGFDIDPSRVNKGKEAMRYFGFENVGFEVRDALDVEIPPGSTVCVFDVLPHLSPDRQERLMAKLAEAAAAGSLVLVRATFSDSPGQMLGIVPRSFWNLYALLAKKPPVRLPKRRDFLAFFERRNLDWALTQLRAGWIPRGELVAIEAPVDESN